MRVLIGCAVLAFVLLVTGCGRHAAHAPKAAPMAATQTPLPEWAPKSPSPEFLRAAKVLKPIPDEELVRVMGSDPTALAHAKRVRMLWPAAWEFFGTLTDEQVHTFLTDWRPKSKKRVLTLAVRSLTPPQRAAFDRYISGHTRAFAGEPQSDYLVWLYKHGAREDLSNVRMGFVALAGHAVHVVACIQPDHGKEDGTCDWFAMI